MLKEKASQAIGWSAIDQFVCQLILFGVSVVMARYVTPEAYGTVALLHLFTGLASVFADGGLSAALIQRKKTTIDDESTVFWFNIAVSAILAAMLYLSAPLIARFYEIPILIPITRIYAFLFLLSSLNSVQSALLSKQLDFKIFLKINLVSGTIAASAGVTLAILGYGIWALVIHTIVNSITRTAALWSSSKWRPAFTFDGRSFRSLFSFGGFIFLSKLLNVGHQRFYTLLIGKWFGVLELGIYNRASSVNQMPSESLGKLINRVAFPIFSSTNHDSTRLRNGMRLATQNAVLINTPVMVGVALVAHPLILTLFGEQWQPAASILPILSLQGLLFPIHLLNLSALQALGYSAKFFKLELIKKSLGITLVLTGSYWGVYGIAWAAVATSFLAFFINAHYSGKLLDYGAAKQAREMVPIFLCSAPMAAGVFYVSRRLETPPHLTLIILILAGVSLYVPTVYFALPNRTAECKRILASFLQR